MAQFNINSHLSNGKRLEWLALPDEGETAQKAVDQVKQAAISKFGIDAFLANWSHVVASNGFVTVRMYP
ncbi:hypothetical protein 3S11_44 [uncultured Caudovirales phage]|uniref:Uncharacterized protein n=1 Tax=uncultured Caudovirales phage TaxID=2100421 RepID=A0A2H4J8N9_9CAUD|nr:hypothetical protein 3S11_44 [uncultured Caudovirales phage]